MYFVKRVDWTSTINGLWGNYNSKVLLHLSALLTKSLHTQLSKRRKEKNHEDFIELLKSKELCRTLEKRMWSDPLALTSDPRKVGVPSTVDTIGLRICPPRSNSCAEILRTGVLAPELVLELEPGTIPDQI